jgi:hypothetical protein
MCVVSYCSTTATSKNPFAVKINNNNNKKYVYANTVLGLFYDALSTAECFYVASVG